MYEENIKILESAVKNHTFIRHISTHRKPDGTMDIAGNLKTWNQGMEAFKKIPLWKTGQTPGYDNRDSLQPEPYIVFIPGKEKKDVLLIAHGGGFETRTGCEGVNTAWYFHELGYPTAILTYRLMPYSRMDALHDMQRAIRLLHSRADELKISGQVVVMGFSAGAMLSANCATHFEEHLTPPADEIDTFSDRPSAAVMGYGAFSDISFPKMFTSPENYGIWGRTREEKIFFAPEKNITIHTPPFFIWQTLSDDGRYGINLAKNLSDIGISYELHIFDQGEHGIAMADGENDLYLDLPHVHHWGRLCDEWLQFKLHQSSSI